MPKSEEWSQKAFEWQEKILQNLKWSDEKGVFYTLEELMAFGTEWPKMIMPEQGWFGDGESVSFCAGEALVGLGVRNFKRITACPWNECFNTSIEEIKQKATPRYVIPLTTMGESRHASRRVKILRIQDETQIYTTMEDLWKFHPRYAMPNKTFTVGNVVVNRLETIELRRCEKDGVSCYLIETGQTIAVPMSQRGDFTIIEDQTSYTLQQVFSNFNLPQRVSFENHPAGMYSTDVLLISETRYEVLIACVPAGLYVEDKGEGRTESWGARLLEDLSDFSFIFLPKPLNDECPHADTNFFTWQYDPEDPICQDIMSRASVFELHRFKDMDVVINANSASMSTVKQLKAENIYDYVKVRDFVRDGLLSPTPSKPPAAPAESGGSTADTALTTHAGATKAVGDPHYETPSRGPEPEAFAKKFQHGLKKARPVLATLKRNKSESESCLVKPDDTPPRSPRSKGTALAPRPRKGPLPPLPNYRSYSKDDMYEQVPDRKNLAQIRIFKTGRLPLPEEVKEEHQGISVKQFPLPKLLPKDMHDQQMKKMEVIAKLGPVPRPPAVLCRILQHPPPPPPRTPKPGGRQAVMSVVQGQTPIIQSQIGVTRGQGVVTTGNVAVVQGQITSIKGRIAMLQGKSTSTQTQEDNRKGEEAVVQGRTAAFQSQLVSAIRGQVAVAQGKSTLTRGQEVITKGKVAVVQGRTAEVQSQVSAIKGQGAVDQGKSTLAHGQAVITKHAKGKVAVVQGRTAVVQGRTAVVQGRTAVTKSQVQTSSTPGGGPRRIKFPPPNGNLVLLSELSSEELALLFKYFSLEKIAEQLKINRVDGEFFENSLEIEDFVCAPFFASEFQLKQIERIRSGKY